MQQFTFLVNTRDNTGMAAFLQSPHENRCLLNNGAFTHILMDKYFNTHRFFIPVVVVLAVTVYLNKILTIQIETT